MNKVCSKLRRGRPKVEFLISTMNRTDLTFLESMFPGIPKQDINALIINQCSEVAGMSAIDEKYSGVRVKSVRSIGLSNSRNMCLENAVGEICVLCDDDCIYLPNAIDSIVDAYRRNPLASIITFSSLSSRTGVPIKARRRKLNHNIFSVFKVSSVEVTFRREHVSKLGVRFDPDFGLGAKYPVGEENIFLADALRAKLKCVSVPSYILYTDENTTGIRVVCDPRLRGRVFARLFRNRIILIPAIIFTSISKYSVYRDVHGFLSYVLLMAKSGLSFRSSELKGGSDARV